MRKEYDAPEMEIIKFETICVITTSPGDGYVDDPFDEGGETEDW